MKKISLAMSLISLLLISNAYAQKPLEGLTVGQLLNVSRLDEVRSTFIKICGAELGNYNRFGRFESLPSTSLFIPGLEPISVNPLPIWVDMNILTSGQLLYFRYRVESFGQGRGSKFKAIAEGDLDGDSISSFVLITGEIDSKTGWARCNEATGENPLE